jgi:hypothetical protein
VLRAFSECTIPYGTDKTLLFLVEYIRDNINNIRIVDPANTNNIISDSLSDSDKESLSTFCTKMIDEINRDSKNILDYFDV